MFFKIEKCFHVQYFYVQYFYMLYFHKSDPEESRHYKQLFINEQQHFKQILHSSSALQLLHEKKKKHKHNIKLNWSVNKKTNLDGSCTVLV